MQLRVKDESPLKAHMPSSLADRLEQRQRDMDQKSGKKRVGGGEKDRVERAHDERTMRENSKRTNHRVRIYA
jgi:hypothetical protein